MSSARLKASECFGATETEETKAAAIGNDLDQFATFVRPLMDIIIAQRHNANDELFRAYFDKPDFGDHVATAITTDLYHQLREQTA